MKDVRILPEVSSIFDSQVRIGGIASQFRASFRWSSWLGWQQWLVLFAMGALVIGIEMRSHNRMWQDHGSGQTIWTDPELIWEIILFGLVLPILGGVFLGYMGRTATERDKIARELALRRELVERMHKAQSWQELADLMVTMPGSVVSADRAWLLAQRSGDEEFDQIARWERIEHSAMSSTRPVSAAVCERCVAATSLQGSRILLCDHLEAAGDTIDCTRYCLWLSTERSGKAALLIDMPSDRPLEAGQISVLDDLGGEMSLAISNARLRNVEERQVDAARQERLRIARDLHDTLGQNISALRLKLEHLSSARMADGQTEFQEELAGMLAVADEAFDQVRNTLEDLRITQDRDLGVALRHYAAQAGERARFSASVQTIGQASDLSARRSRQIMYIAREALNNIEKHAGAQHVDIVSRWVDGQLLLTVGDDGRGFDPEELDADDCYGMTIMGERSRAINADLAIESTPGQGTEVTLRVPLSRRAAAAPGSQ